MNWKKAYKHLLETKEAYAGLLKMPNVNPCFALGAIMEIEGRFDGGERTESLFKAMMELK